MRYQRAATKFPVVLSAEEVAHSGSRAWAGAAIPRGVQRGLWRRLAGSAITHHPHVHVIVLPLGSILRMHLPGSGRLPPYPTRGPPCGWHPPRKDQGDRALA